MTSRPTWTTHRKDLENQSTIKSNHGRSNHARAAIDAQSEAKLTEVTTQMSLDTTWVTSGDGNYELSVNGPADGSNVSPAVINQLIESLRSLPGVDSVGIAP